jgi:hypothetical protein
MLMLVYHTQLADTMLMRCRFADAAASAADAATPDAVTLPPCAIRRLIR